MRGGFRRLCYSTLMLLFTAIFVSASGCTHSDVYKFKYTLSEESKGVYRSMEDKENIMQDLSELLSDLPNFPVSFKYGNKVISGLGSPLKLVSKNESVCGKRTDIVFSFQYKDELGVDLCVSAYPDHCAYEWKLEFTNIGNKNTERISEINASDICFEGSDPVIKGIYGDGGIGDGPYSPYTVDLSDIKIKNFCSETGRPSEIYFPYFNLEYGDGGVFVSVGWSGQWNANFAQTDDGVRLKAEQKVFDAYLEPGETVRSPLMSFLFYRGRDEQRSMNLWRHWMIDCNMRLIDGEKFAPALMSSASWKYSCMEKATDENQCQWIRDYIKNGIELDYFWMDAGWYFKNGSTSLSSWLESGNWSVDEKRFPSKFADISAYAASQDVKTILWFEPEVVRLTNDLLDDDGIKPEWLLGIDGQWRLGNYGDPDFVKWLSAKVIGIMEEGGISLYRQDFGFVNPVNTWLANDAEGRRGITENLYVQGYLKYWDNIIAWDPNVMLDTCASGGNRMDLETLRRSVPLHKTDWDYSDIITKQSMHQSLFAWIPYFGAVTTGPVDCYTADEYQVYSTFCQAMVINYVPNGQMNWDVLGNICDIWQKVKDYYYSDYYTLTPWSHTDSDCRGWEFFDSEKDSGFIQLFCPDKATCNDKEFKLYGLTENNRYQICDAVTGNVICTGSGQELMTLGITVSMEPHTSIVYTIIGQTY